MVKLDNDTGWRARKVQVYALERYGLTISGDFAATIANDDFTKTLSSDNVPAVASALRADWLRRVRRAGCQASYVELPIVVPLERVSPHVYAPGQFREFAAALRSHAPWFGICPELATARSDFDRLRPEMSMRDWLRLYYPAAHDYLIQFHRTWHRAEALDYLEGRLPIRVTILHPALVKLFSMYLASMISPTKPTHRLMSVWLGRIFEPSFAVCPLAADVYSW